MTEIVKINIENEMDLILIHKRTMKLAELCGISLITQTTFATAVSEIGRCVIGKQKKTTISLNIQPLKLNKKCISIIITTNDVITDEHKKAIQYASRLVSDILVNESGDHLEIKIVLPLSFSGLINSNKIESFISYFQTELPLSPYDEIRKKNIQLIELADKLKDSEDQYKKLTETLPLMVFSTNVSGNITYGNKWFKDSFNITEIPLGKLHWTSFIHSSNHRLVKEQWESSMLSSSHFRTQAKINPKIPSDDPLWHLISLLPVKNDSTQLTGWTGFFVDINAQKEFEQTLKNNTQLKAAQKQLLSSQIKLEQKVKELNKSNHDLEQFAYIASHDLQEPLRKIRNYSELLERSVDDPSKAKLYISKIDTSTERMSKLIQAVLNYSKLSLTETVFEDVNLEDIINNVKTDVELIIEEKKAVIKSEHLPIIIGIKQQLHQLFYNLISNALKFTADSPEIKISCKLLNVNDIKNYEELHSSVKYILISVKDNGIGFEQEYANNIFTIFKRLNPKAAYEGTGIGLALCKKIVDNHHGIIWANSSTGNGAEFNIILPVN